MVPVGRQACRCAHADVSSLTLVLESRFVLVCLLLVLAFVFGLRACLDGLLRVWFTLVPHGCLRGCFQGLTVAGVACLHVRLLEQHESLQIPSSCTSSNYRAAALNSHFLGPQRHGRG